MVLNVMCMLLGGKYMLYNHYLQCELYELHTQNTRSGILHTCHDRTSAHLTHRSIGTPPPPLRAARTVVCRNEKKFTETSSVHNAGNCGA